MKILVISDTHGNTLAPLEIIKETGVELVVHLGDHLDDARALERQLDLPFIKVPGNSDPRATEPRELIQSISGRTFFMTHGDLYRVKSDLNRLFEKTKELKASVALFGHTHVPLIKKLDGVLLINPGTLMSGSESKSYAILTVTPFNISAEIIHLI